MKNKGLEYNKWIFQELENLSKLRCERRSILVVQKDLLLTNLVAST